MKMNYKIFDNVFILLFIFFIISFLIYLPGIDGRFTSDFYNWIRDYKHGSLSELWTCFGYPGLHQMYHIPFYFSYKIFGLNSMAWHLEFTLLHAINALLFYYFAKEILQITNKNLNFALLASLLFLLSPFQTEVVAWGATIHYLFTLLLFLASFVFLIKYLKTKNFIFLFLFHFFYILDLLTMELPLVFPAIFVIFSYITKDYYQVQTKTILSKILFIHIFILIAYFTTTKLIIGKYIGHYGMESHLRFDLKTTSTILYNYFLKFISFYRYIGSVKIKTFLLHLFNNDGFKIITFLSLFIFVIKNIFFSSKKKTKLSTFILINLVFFIISLLPVLNIEMSSLTFITTDRYSYVASIFYLMVVVLIISSFSKKIALITGSVYLLLSIYLLINTVKIWKETGILANNIIESYNYYNQEVYAINNIDIYKGAYLFRNGFVAAIELQKNIDIKNTYHDISKVFSNEPFDSVNIQIARNEIIAAVIPWGRWFWIKETNKNYSAQLGYLNQSVIIKPKEKIKLIYLSAGKWKDVNY